MTRFKTQHPAGNPLSPWGRGEYWEEGQRNHRRLHPFCIKPPRNFVPLVFRLPTISLCTKHSRCVDHLSFFACRQLLFYLSGCPHVCHVPFLFSIRQPLVLDTAYSILDHYSSIGALPYSHTVVAQRDPRIELGL